MGEEHRTKNTVLVILLLIKNIGNKKKVVNINARKNVTVVPYKKKKNHLIK